MAADRTHDDAVGTGHDIDIKVVVYLECGEDAEVELMGRRTLIGIACIILAGDLLMIEIIFQRFRRDKVEGLNVQHLFDKALLVHLGDLSGDAAKSVAALYVLSYHLLTDIAASRKGRTAGAHLHGEAVIEIAGGFADLCSHLGYQKLLGVL